MSVAEQAQVLEAWGHKQPDTNAAPMSRSVPLSTFQPRTHETTLDCQDLVHRCTWPSFSPASASALPASLSLLNLCWKEQDYSKAAETWRCTLFPKGTIVERVADHSHFLSLGDYGDFGLCVVQAIKVPLGQNTAFCLPAGPHFHLTWEHVLDLDNYLVLPTTATTPARVLSLDPGATQVGILALQTGDATTPLRNAAKEAFWHFKLGRIQALKRHFGLQVSKGENLREALTDLIEEALPKITGPQLQDILLKRCQVGEGLTSQVLPEDVLNEVFSQDDRKLAKDHVEETEKARNTAVAWREEVRAGRTGGSSKAGQAGEGSGKKRGPKDQPGKKKGLPKVVDVASLKGLLPQRPGCTPFFEAQAQRVRCFYKRAGNFRASCSSSIALHGEREACIQILKWAWNEYEQETGDYSLTPEF
eukprot:10028917-Lingulodinium_polyedra.AAC.1